MVENLQILAVTLASEPGADTLRPPVCFDVIPSSWEDRGEYYLCS